MPNYRRANVKGAIYFFTVITYRRQKILCDAIVRNALRKGIQTVRKTHPFFINAWVLLPDHLHCIWTLPENDADYSLRWAKLKRFVTKQCGGLLYREDLMNESKSRRNESTIWQRRFWEHLIRDDQDMKNHMDYIHYNPVKHNIVDCVKKWPYSTFHRYCNNGIYSEDWGSGYIVDNQSEYGE